jgi:hypothetical protein
VSRIIGRNETELVANAIAASLARSGGAVRLTHAEIVAAGLRWDRVRSALGKSGTESHSDEYAVYDQYDQHGCSVAFRGRDASGNAWSVTLGSAVRS